MVATVGWSLVARSHGRMDEWTAADDGLRAKTGETARDMARPHLIEDHGRDSAQAYRSLFPAR